VTLVLTADSASELFTQACRAVLASGHPAAPRGLPTVEVLGASLTLTSPRRRLVDVPPARIINPAFAAAEAVWILSGSDDSWIYLYNERLADCADDGKLMGAYGPRLRRWHGMVDQLARVRQQLTDDPGTRRAVIQLFDPETDSRDYKDVPCTLGYRFFLRDGLLHMHTTMRSQDLWLGFCYDIFTATIMQELLAGWLGAGLGIYWLCADSLHLYDHDRAAAQELDTPQPPDLAASRQLDRSGGDPGPARDHHYRRPAQHVLPHPPRRPRRSRQVRSRRRPSRTRHDPYRDTPEWQRMSRIGRAARELLTAIRETAEDYWAEIRRDIRVQGFARTLAVRVSLTVSGTAHLLAGRLERAGHRGTRPWRAAWRLHQATAAFAGRVMNDTPPGAPARMDEARRIIDDLGRGTRRPAGPEPSRAASPPGRDTRTPGAAALSREGFPVLVSRANTRPGAEPAARTPAPPRPHQAPAATRQ
jgi:thymidylate synthase